MKSIAHYYLIPSFLFFFVLGTAAQEMRFGKYAQAEIDLKVVEFEPEANAVVIEEFSKNQFAGAILHNNIHRRIKILKESGKSYGDIVISFYFGSDGVENILKLNAQIVNFVNGKEEVVKLSKRDFFEVDAGNGNKEIRFTFPNVKEGSILEYEYLKIDKNITFLDSHIFQNNVPTLKSVYHIEVPSYLNFRTLLHGHKTINTNHKTQREGVYQWTLTDLRAMKGEPYMNHFVDYLERVEFQLAGYSFRNSNGYGTSMVGYKEVFANWHELAKVILEIPNVNSYIHPNKTLSEKLSEVRTPGESETQKAKEIYQHVVANFKFNGYSGDIPSQNLKNTLDLKSGSRADINLGLLAHLKAKGIESFPVLISSKGNGRSTLSEAPFADQFNQLILLVKADGKQYFVDATDPSLPFGYMPLENHTSSGLALLEEGSGLIPIPIIHRSGISQYINIKNEQEQIISEGTIRFLDYDAVDIAKANKKKGQEVFKKEFLVSSGGEFLDYQFEEKNEPRKLVDTKIKTQMTDLNAETLFIVPFQYQRWTENPFQAAYRVFPVDFNYTFTDNFTAMIYIPEGYEIDDFPEETMLSIPGESIYFSYKVSSLDGVIKVNASVDLKKNIIEAAYYPDLKYLLEIAISKLKEPIVLKKIAMP